MHTVGQWWRPCVVAWCNFVSGYYSCPHVLRFCLLLRLPW